MQFRPGKGLPKPPAPSPVHLTPHPRPRYRFVDLSPLKKPRAVTPSWLQPLSEIELSELAFAVKAPVVDPEEPRKEPVAPQTEAVQEAEASGKVEQKSEMTGTPQ